jgi:hypothetical protein
MTPAAVTVQRDWLRVSEEFRFVRQQSRIALWPKCEKKTLRPALDPANVMFSELAPASLLTLTKNAQCVEVFVPDVASRTVPPVG